MRDASYLKLKNAEIGYTLPKELMRTLQIEGIRVFVDGSHLLRFDKLKVIIRNKISEILIHYSVPSISELKLTSNFY